MRVLLVHRYFWPDTPPYATMLRLLGEGWVRQGHRVSVFSSQPSYKRSVASQTRPHRECLGGMDVLRARLPFRGDGSALRRAVNTTAFLVQLAVHLFRNRALDLVVMSTVPQVFGARVASAICRLRGQAFIYHMQDIHPEGLVAVGMLRDGLVSGWLRGMDTRTCRSSYRVIVLSSDMRRTLLRRDPALAGSVEVISNPPVVEMVGEDAQVPTELFKEPGRFRAVFAGNIGRFQDLDTLIEAALGIVETEDIEIVLVGDGIARQALVERVAQAGAGWVRFIPHQRADVADALIADADVALITLAPGVCDTAFPSKLINYTRSGTALLVGVETDSELARTVEREGMGVAVKNGDPVALRDALRRFASDPGLVESCSRRSREFHDKTFGIARTLERWAEVLEGLSDKAQEAV